MKRRQFLRLSSLALAGLAAGCRPDRVAPTVYVPGSTRPPPSPTPTNVPQPTATLAPPLTSVPITPIKDLYVTSYRLTPKPEELTRWALKIDGLVETPLTLTMEDIHALPAIESMRTLSCISNPVGGSLIGNIVWTGIDFATIVERIGIKAEAAYVNFEAADGYFTSVALKWLTQPDVMLAYLANGEALPPEHGYPLRILIPGLYGQKQPKWITRITFSDKEKLGYWEQEFRGWSNVATVNTISQIREPAKNISFTAPIRLTGMAFSGLEAITKVEIAIRTDPNEQRVWQPVVLIAPPSPLVWTWWTHVWSPPTPALYRIAVRATDSTGFTQAHEARGTFAGAFPDGSDAIHEVLLKLD
ncbi:MAG: molybdopterin-dependent oxidoreductase [Anaerolineae bacterium]|nr:molybdopterin-dependent oxidoreductase [Anaerolineae bacterium]